MKKKILTNQYKKIWKIQLTIAINLISYKENDEEQVMHWKSDKIEFIICDNADETFEERFESLLNRYQTGLETSMSRSDFIFDWVHLL